MASIREKGVTVQQLVGGQGASTVEAALQWAGAWHEARQCMRQRHGHTSVVVAGGIWVLMEVDVKFHPKSVIIISYARNTQNVGV
jgi:hypothetical protein